MTQTLFAVSALGSASCALVLSLGDPRYETTSREGETEQDAAVPPPPSPRSPNDAAPVPCPFTDADVELCEGFDDPPPLLGWGSRQFFGQDGGLEIAASDASSPPNHLRVTYEPSADAGGQRGAVLARSFESSATRVAIAMVYRLEELALLPGATAGSATAVGLQSFSAGETNVNVQLEVAAGPAPDEPAFRIRIYKGSTLLGSPPFERKATLGRFTRVTLAVELAPPETTVTLAVDGDVVIDRVALPTGVKLGDRWELRLGGFSGGAPAVHRPKVVQDFDDLTVEALRER